jgi:predicted metal-binding membrane protein
VAARTNTGTGYRIIAAIVVLEKLHRHGELISHVLGGLFLAAGITLLVEPSVLSAMS